MSTTAVARVPIVYPAWRCSAVGCGDKIKDSGDKGCWQHIEEDGTERRFHIACCDEEGRPLPYEP